MSEHAELDDRVLTAITLEQLAHAHWASDQFQAQLTRVQAYVKSLERALDELREVGCAEEGCWVARALREEVLAHDMDPEDHPSGCLCDLHVDHTGHSTHHPKGSTGRE